MPRFQAEHLPEAINRFLAVADHLRQHHPGGDVIALASDDPSGDLAGLGFPARLRQRNGLL